VRVSEFFEVGKTYVERHTAFRAPETVGKFQRVAVADHPAGRGKRAFGFMCTAYPGDNWTSYALNQDHWDEGWAEERSIEEKMEEKKE
jgi:hypothetical protein